MIAVLVASFWLAVCIAITRVIRNRREARIANEIIAHRMRKAIEECPEGLKCPLCPKAFTAGDSLWNLRAHYALAHRPAPIDIVDRH